MLSFKPTFLLSSFTFIRNGQEQLPHVQGQGRRPRGATPHPRPGTAAGRSYPTSEVKGDNREEPPRVRGQGRDWEEQPHVQGVVAVWAQEGLEEPSHIEGQKGRQEEISLIQGKEQWLCFAGATVKRYCTPKVREIQVKW